MEWCIQTGKQATSCVNQVALHFLWMITAMYVQSWTEKSKGQGEEPPYVN